MLNTETFETLVHLIKENYPTDSFMYSLLVKGGEEDPAPPWAGGENICGICHTRPPRGIRYPLEIPGESVLWVCGECYTKYTGWSLEDMECQA